MFQLLIFLTYLTQISLCSIIDYSAVKMMTINAENSFFGYSILLQRGTSPLVIVGAPRKKQGYRNTGSVYRCNLTNSQCEEYKRISTTAGTYPVNKTGDFLGAAIDGDDTVGGQFFTCAPRFIELHSTKDYFLNGRCFQIRNSLDLNGSGRLIQPLSSEKNIGLQSRIPYYNAAFGEAGLGLCYLKKFNVLLVGAPGKSLWSGALVRIRLNTYSSVIFPQQQDVSKYSDNFYGYSIGWGRFFWGNIYYVGGAPRAAELKGTVVFYDITNIIKHQLFGEEMGSYFGASMLVVNKNETNDDILIGAPMYKGSTWDEGCVYYYKNNKKGGFNTPIKLSNGKSGSRFGTVMAATGDINLDTWTDCAISAPCEDDGTGAVYIFFGTESGFANDNFQRISPSQFSFAYPGHIIRGFGLGISNGNDIDNNKHNDIVIGAYKSGQIFFFPTKQLFDVTMNMTSNRSTIYTSTTDFSIKYCISFIFRNKDRNKALSFVTNIIVEDDRLLNQQNISKIVTLKTSDVQCTSETMYLKKNHLNVEPLFISYGYKLYQSKDNFTANTFRIPMAYECGADNVCQTNLKMKAAVNINKVVVGMNTDCAVNVTIYNSGESAYQTKLYLKVSPEISLINLRECDLQNGSYVCLISQILNEQIEKTFLLDLTNIQSNRTNLPLRFKVTSIGQDVDYSDNEFELNIPVVLQNNPHIDSRSVPEQVFLNESESTLKLTHTFLIGNHGPSPLDLNLSILVPELWVGGINILHIRSIEGEVDGADILCSYPIKNEFNVSKLGLLRQNSNTKIMSCLASSDNCTIISCLGGYFPKSSQNAVFSLKMTLAIAPAVTLFEKKHKLALISSAFMTNGTQEFCSYASTSILLSRNKNPLPLWIYVISATSGLALLMLLILILYKCHFFKRTYKEMMETDPSDDDDDEEQREEMYQDEEL